MSQLSEKKLHPRNKHVGSYDFSKLVKAVPQLSSYITTNPSGLQTVPFANEKAVKLLNQALLKTEYGMDFWDIPPGQLCPPIPGRADYVHYLADIWQEQERSTRRVLDIGVGANAIYPIIAVTSYGWKMVGADCSRTSLKHAQLIVDSNEVLRNRVQLRHQPEEKHVLKNVILKDDYFDAVMCNPPFFKSQEEAFGQNTRKVKNLQLKGGKVQHNFGGQSNELWYQGGELAFITTMIRESVQFKTQVGWFTSLVSNKDNLYALKKMLAKVQAVEVREVRMQQGNKQSRFLAWRMA